MMKATLSTLILFLISNCAFGASGLIGDTYSVSLSNFPGNLGITIDPETQEEMDHGSAPVDVRFDGLAEQVGGMRVNERVVEFAGGNIVGVQAAGIDGLNEFDLIDWELEGEVVELSFQTIDGSYISSEPDDQSGYTIGGLDWANSEADSLPEFFETGFYIYYSQDGTPISGYEVIQPEIGLLVGPHPFDSSVPEVVYIAYSRGQVEDVTEPYEGGTDWLGGTSQLDVNDGSWSLLGTVLGVDDLAERPANGYHVGMLVTPPEGSFSDPTGLRPGDADQDLDFDQFDLIRVQVAAKYLTGEPATWGEGDWNGAPGGSPGSPPAGDGRFDQVDIIGALSAAVYLTGPYAAIAPDGREGDGQTSVVYDPGTGELRVDAPANVQLTSVNIDSAAGVFTGADAENLGGSFDNDADGNIFKATFGGSFGSVSFGNVAQAGLSREFVLSDLSVVGSLQGGGSLGDVDLVYVPEPGVLIHVLVAWLTLVLVARRSLPAPSGRP